nr:YdeI/OmpD-associated family protein [Microlunatus antarcticus]
MLPRGQAVVDEARSSGAWTLLDDAETLTEPPELAAALDTDPEARRQWDAFPRSPKRAALVWLGSAKRAATREKRVTEIVSRASQGLRTP